MPRFVVVSHPGLGHHEAVLDLDAVRGVRHVPDTMHFEVLVDGRWVAPFDVGMTPQEANLLRARWTGWERTARLQEG